MIPYTTILADVPWRYDQKLTMADGVKRSSDSQYPTMSVEEIEALYTPSRMVGNAFEVAAVMRRGVGMLPFEPGKLCGQFPVQDTAFLFFWVTNPFLLDGTGVRVCRAWGFEPKQIIPWIKGRLEVWAPLDMTQPRAKLILNTGMGHITRGVTEHLIVATRGRYTPLVKVKNEHGLIIAPEESVILSPRGAHSAKPVAQYDLIERVCPGPYLELFARKRRPGWTSWGLGLESSPPVVAGEIVESFLPEDPEESVEWPG